MSETEIRSKTLSEESVDDILAGILNPDGSFNDEFNGLLKKYVGGETAENPFRIMSDISDRLDEPAPVRVEFEESGDISFKAAKPADERIEEKIPEAARALYYAAAAEAQRPEFTSTGDVKYPVMGSGASEERVIYDADWEETARKEAQRLQRVRQDRMLRGDSAYARSFSGNSAVRPSYNSYYVQEEAPASVYIDPLSRDDDFESMHMNSQYYSSSKKSFFPEGFSVTQKNNQASGGKTERTGSMRNKYTDTPVKRDTSWLQVEEKPEKKKGLFGRRRTSAVPRERVPSVEEALEKLERQEKQETAPAPDSVSAQSVSLYYGEDISVVERETEGLRSTVAEIVDKYNKRSEEDERRRIAEEIRLEDERREAELRERRRLEEIRLLKENMSRQLAFAVEEAEAEDDFDDYEDFSAEPVKEERKEDSSPRVYGVVFDPAAFDEEEKDGELTEKFSED